MEGIKYNKLANLSYGKFKRCTGVSKYVFEMLFLVVSDGLKLKKKIGRTNKLSIADRILMFLEYYREYRTFFHIGLDYGLHEVNAQRNIEQIEQILFNSGYFKLEGKRVLARDTRITNIRVDVTECPAQRPKKKVKNKQKIKRSSKQKHKYSGKKKKHTHKIQVVQNASTKGIICLDFAKGGEHDFKLFKKSKLHIHSKCFTDVDLGYQGIADLHANVNIPKKKARRPNQTKEEKKKAKNNKLSKAERKQAKLLLLSKEDRLNNKKLATQRVGIEHINRQLKVFKIIQQTYRSHQKFGMRATLIATFINENLFFF